MRDVGTWQRGLGTLCNAAFVLTLAGPLLQAERRMVARVQVAAALKPFLRMCDSVKNKLTRRAVPRHAVDAGDVCPICHEELADEDLGPLGFCRWGCGRAVAEACAAAGPYTHLKLPSTSKVCVRVDGVACRSS